MSLNEQSTIAEVAARHNELSGKNADPKTLAKRGKAKLLEQIAAMEAAAPKPDGMTGLLKQMQSSKAAEEAKPPKAKAAKKEAKPKKEKGPVIRVVAEGLLLEVVTHDEDGRPYGHSYETVLDRIRQQFDGAKTTVACLRWYAVHMRERGEKVPNRPRAQPAKKAEAE